MKSHRVTTTATLAALAITLSAPTGAAANSLLSGYGGPGEGNQAILGATLLKGTGGGSSGGKGSGSSSATATGASESLALPAKKSARPSRRGSSGTNGGKSSAKSHASGSGSAPYSPISSQPAIPAADVASSGSVGLSSGDVLYILLAVALLILTGAITRRLARPVR